MVGWDAYKVINIKYANQVVGVKNETLLDSLKAATAHKAKFADSVVHAAVIPVKTDRDSMIKAQIENIVDEPADTKPAPVNRPKAGKPATAKTDNKPTAVKPAANKTDKKTSIKN